MVLLLGQKNGLFPPFKKCSEENVVKNDLEKTLRKMWTKILDLFITLFYMRKVSSM